jgi:hypothetical protein
MDVTESLNQNLMYFIGEIKPTKIRNIFLFIFKHKLISSTLLAKLDMFFFSMQYKMLLLKFHVCIISVAVSDLSQVQFQIRKIFFLMYNMK